MRFIDYIKTSLRSLKRRKMRTFLTAFAVSIGAMLIILMVSLGVGVQRLVIDAIKSGTPGNTIAVSPYKYENIKIVVDTGSEDQGIINEPKFKRIDEAALRKIRNMNEVEDMSVFSSIPQVDVEVAGKSRNTTFVIAADLNYSVIMEEEVEVIRLLEKNKDLNPLLHGRMLTKQDINGALIGEKMLKRLGIDDYSSVIGKELAITAKLPDAPGIPQIDPLIKKVTVVGVIHEKFSYGDKIIISLDTAKPLLAYLNLENNYYENKGPDTVIVTAKKLTDVPVVTEEIEKMGYGVSSIQSMIKSIKNIFAIVQAVLAVIGVVIIFVASIGVINTMTMSIYERIRSIGIMKALGASRKEIRRLFIVESGVIGFIGGLLGIVFSMINVEIIKIFINSFLKSKGVNDLPKLFATPLWLVAGTIGFAVLISVLAGLYPAGKASKLDPVESLRYE